MAITLNCSIPFIRQQSLKALPAALRRPRPYGLLMIFSWVDAYSSPTMAPQLCIPP